MRIQVQSKLSGDVNGEASFAHVVMAALGMRYDDLRRFALSRDGPVPGTKSSSSTRHPLVAIFVASCNGHDGSVGRSVICG
jgi:hypothetical protein